MSKLRAIGRKKLSILPLGEVVQADGTRTKLYFRDVAKKIIHGARYEWRLGNDDPKIVIHADKSDKWQRAELSIFHLMALIGGLMF